jgi:hypothetical protein
MSNAFYGWYDDPTQAADRPSYEPPRDGPCLFCGNPISADDVRTHSIMYESKEYAKRAYFYRTHRSCDANAKTGMDGFIFDMIARNGD